MKDLRDLKDSTIRDVQPIGDELIPSTCCPSRWTCPDAPEARLDGGLHGPPGVDLRANLKSISYKYHLFEVAFVWELTKESIHLPVGCLQGGVYPQISSFHLQVSDFGVRFFTCKLEPRNPTPETRNSKFEAPDPQNRLNLPPKARLADGRVGVCRCSLV